MGKKMRLNRFLAQAGVASRRKADELIEEGLVQINGRTVYELGVSVDPKQDQVKVRGKLIKPESLRYFVFYKPRQVMTTMADPEGRPCVADYFRNIKEKVFPVGRLDWDSEGLLIVTNDGDYAQKVLHPSAEVTKTYLVKLNDTPSEKDFEKLKRGVSIPEGGRVRAKEVSFAQHGTSPDKAWVRIIVTEGKKHQVRQMFFKLGYDVLRLKRVAIGRLKLGSLKPGEMKSISPRQAALVFEVDQVSERHKRAAGLLRERRSAQRATSARKPRSRS
ncbi:MAG: rRNA pseudouridine synthase [Bdellovibrionaceae bacterium]|jgi:23S rRNA pseudouridine2605 synthase|nr:rRNA pseudouridine synthase [Pseudobdellovibrionaceae bacterium]